MNRKIKNTIADIAIGIGIAALIIGMSKIAYSQELADVVGTQTTDRAAALFLLSLPADKVEQGAAIRCDGGVGELKRGTISRVDLEVIPGVDCAVAHTHVKFRERKDRVTAAFYDNKNTKPSSGDALAVNAGYPNYVRGTDGVVRVLERRSGVITLRVVDIETTPLTD